jgi:hypothetical protein
MLCIINVGTPPCWPHLFHMGFSSPPPAHLPAGHTYSTSASALLCRPPPRPAGNPGLPSTIMLRSSLPCTVTRHPRFRRRKETQTRRIGEATKNFGAFIPPQEQKCSTVVKWRVHFCHSYMEAMHSEFPSSHAFSANLSSGGAQCH